MDLASRTVRITGGASGIGLGLAGRFLAAGSRVAVCGRRSDRLDAARSELPGRQTRCCDAAGACVENVEGRATGQVIDARRFA